MGAVQQISAKQVADLVTSLARGRTVAQTATRMHMAESVVEEIGRLNGYPNATELNRNSRILNKQLRTATPDEDLDVDVPVAEAPSSSDEVAKPEADEPADEEDVVLWRCVRRGCGYDLLGPKSAAEDEVQRLVELHKQTHRDQGTIEIPGPVHVGHHAGERRPHDCAACREETAVEPPVVVLGEVIDETTTPDAVIAAIDATLQIAEGLVEVAAADDDHVEVAHVRNGSTVPEAVGQILATMGGQLAATPDSPDPLPAGEATPAVAADPAMSEQHGDAGDVEEPPVAPQPAPSEGWLAAGPRTIERLLDEAAASGHAPLVDLAERLRMELQRLADRLDRWVDHAEQRKAILHELDILGRRQDELTEKLGRLDADDTVPSAVASQTPTMFAQAKNDLAAAILEDKASEHSPTKPRPRKAKPVMASRSTGRAQAMKTSLWGQLTDNVRAQVRPWCEENGVPVSPTGRCSLASIEAYLAAHPEDDPRPYTPEENQ